MGFSSIQHQRVVVDVQRLLSTVNTKASANVIAQTDGNRRKALKAIVGVGCTYGVMVDLDLGETNCQQFLLGAHLIH